MKRKIIPLPKKLKIIRISCFNVFRKLNVAKYVIKNLKVEIINPFCNKQKTALTKNTP